MLVIFCVKTLKRAFLLFTQSQQSTTSKTRTFKLSIRTLVVGIVLFSIVLTATVAIVLQFYFSRAITIDNALTQYQIAAHNTSDHYKVIEERATRAANLLAAYPFLAENTVDTSAVRELFAGMMRSNNMLYSIYLGYPNGDFFEVVNLDNSKAVRASIKAAAQDRWVVNRVSVVDGTRVRQLDYYDADFSLRETRDEDSDYDTRTRHWYQNAQVNTVFKSASYLFQYLQIPGKTYSIKLPQSQIVLGVDVSLQSFSEHLQQQKLSDAADMFVYQASGEVVATNIVTTPEAITDVQPLTLTQAQRNYIEQLGVVKITNETDWPPIDFAVSGKPEGYSVDVIRIVAQMLSLQIEFINGLAWSELENKYEQNEVDIIQPVTRYSRVAHLGKLSDSVITLPYALAIKSGSEKITDLAQLQHKTLAIPKSWALSRILQATYPGLTILDVASSRDALAAVQQGKAYGTIDSSLILRYTASQYFFDQIEFIDDIVPEHSELPTDYHLLINDKFRDLPELINLALAQITPLQHQTLQQKWLTLNGVESGAKLAVVPYKALIDFSQKSGVNQALQAFTQDNIEYLSFITPLTNDNNATEYFAVVIKKSALGQRDIQRVYISIAITAGCLLLLLPLSWIVVNPVVRPINQLFESSIKVKNRDYKEVSYQPTMITEVDELSHAMLDMAQSIQQHEDRQRALMDSFIQLIAEAIDQKSPYTGGHCARVPELALMLVDAAQASTEPAFKSFRFKNDDEYREFKIAAWLHDCGKITMPEHIVDKGSKLEAIYNRIHEVRMRFEVLWRDAEITYLKAIAENPADAEHVKQIWQQQQQKLLDDFMFVARSNVGGESFSKADQQRLQGIAKITWWRHFDDRVGLSPVEEARVQSCREDVALPAKEYLLADKAEHIIPRQRAATYDPSYGIKMTVPEHLYNQGEIYNLSITRGTLTAEDRFKINEHMISTIHLLEGLPFPPELARVPRYASTHHETLKGTGYPRKLYGHELSIPERILVVADIFEALTAADRPYKKAKSIRESLDIMHQMVLNEHIDPDVFALFLTSGVYLKYAKRFLAAEQIDEIDVKPYLTS